MNAATTHQAVDDDAPDDRGHAVEDVGGEAEQPVDPRGAVFRKIDAAEHADRHADAARRAPSSSNVPTMALAMPPPGSPTGFGSWVKKSQFMRRDALCRRGEQKTSASGATVASAAAARRDTDAAPLLNFAPAGGESVGA